MGAEEPGPASAAVEPVRGARAEIRRQLREQRRLKTIALLLASLLVLGALPMYFGLRAATRDPVFNSLDALAVPAWAATDTVDGVSGSRWCFIECRFRERTVTSERKWEETAQAYETALGSEGWRPWKVAFCPEQQVEGHYTCWRRDELTLDLWVRQPACQPPVAGQPAPGATPDATARDAENCEGSLVSIKVRNAIADERTGPQPRTDPSLTGEDPDPLLTGDPLGGLTPTPTPS
ncbi:hypothetical protein I0C86_08235 [Plantactinospora sp. S1510]|uniref:Uncharacterized protein n=1 Tax=Plantactinospora alkalitolerans TaxID=2789879 RepID=A0ABS0GSA9_9ACTN|nr:hypothetical protein [Plantactinospora alkalitolerans]MBF9128971.1 hypothetical protein [Plantactinospora alkalitolerans]